MSAGAGRVAGAAAGPRSPGVYLQARRVRETRAVEPPTGIPVFVGFADAPRGRGGAALVIDRWSAPVFEQAVRPDGASFLPMAVHGFFANGGRRCIVMAVPPAAGSAGLVDALQPGGPLEDRSEPDLVCVPDAMLHADATFPYLVQDAALRHCERMGDRFAILDAPRLPDAAGDDLVDAVLLQAAALRSAYGALFFPWIGINARDADDAPDSHAGDQAAWRLLPRQRPEPDDRSLTFGPACGHLAGLFARIDGLAGPQRPPACIDIDGAVDVAVHLADEHYARLNDGGINCLLGWPGRGIVAGGARTRSGHASWHYISTARVIIGFRRWLADGMRDLVFEPNTAALWDRIRLRLVSRCMDLLRAGALAGADPAQAFFVQCDAELNAPELTEAGQVIAHVGLAPSVPAEFIVVRIEQFPGGQIDSQLV